MKALIYGIEIVKAIPARDGDFIEDIEYCEGWSDHANMGISVIGACELPSGRLRVFTEDNQNDFFKATQDSDLLVGFNNIPFDNQVINHNWANINDGRCYDLLRETWVAAGLGPTFQYPSHAGYGLDAICYCNFDIKKTGNGALAPVLWQQGKIGQVIDYCLNDVWMTKVFFEHAVLEGKPIICPKTGDELALRGIA